MSRSRSSPRIAIVAGEVSGDRLGAGLMRALSARLPGARFEGIGGSQMRAAGLASLHPMEALSVLGVTEILGRLPGLLRLRKALVERWRADPPDLYIGVDSPGFNLGVEERLRAAGIATLHYVSPQVWAWRSWRVRRIRRAVDRMLVLFPFEQKFYRDRGLAATFVGHPLADSISGSPDRQALRKRLRFQAEGAIVALLPGSRASELRAHADLFVRTALWLAQRHPDMQFVAPFVSRETRAQFEAAIEARRAWDLPLTRMYGHAHDAIGVSDVVLTASGTAALETLLLRRPMVVTYRVSLPSYLLIRSLSKLEYFSMPNHLAGRSLVPELLQYDATPEKLGTAVEQWLADPERVRATVSAYDRIAARLKRGADARAAAAVHALLRRSRNPAAGR